jgi:hypothetical protein
MYSLLHYLKRYLHSLVIMPYSSYPSAHNLHSFRPSFVTTQLLSVITNPFSRLYHNEQRKGESVRTPIFVCKFSPTALANSEAFVWEWLCVRGRGVERGYGFLVLGDEELWWEVIVTQFCVKSYFSFRVRGCCIFLKIPLQREDCVSIRGCYNYCCKPLGAD